MEQSLVIIKPDGVQRGLVGEIIRRLEARGLRLAALKFMRVDAELAARHYAVHEGKPFYEGLVTYITSGPVVVMAWAGPRAIEAIRQSVGATNPVAAAPGTIRADLALDISRNLIHASDAGPTAEFELGLWFGADDFVTWEREDQRWTWQSLPGQ